MLQQDTSTLTSAAHWVCVRAGRVGALLMRVPGRQQYTSRLLVALPGVGTTVRSIVRSILIARISKLRSFQSSKPYLSSRSSTPDGPQQAKAPKRWYVSQLRRIYSEQLSRAQTFWFSRKTGGDSPPVFLENHKELRPSGFRGRLEEILLQSSSKTTRSEPV